MNNRVLSLLVLILAGGLFFGYVNPTWTNDIAELKVAIANSDAALRAAQNYLAREQQLIEARNAINPTDLERLNTFLPDAVNNVGLILSLNSLAARSGLAITSIDVTQNTATNDQDVRGRAIAVNPVNSIDLSVAAEGSYAAFQNFLTGVERSARLLDVREITITGTETGRYQYQMIIRLYWLR